MLVSEVVFQGWMCNEITEQVPQNFVVATQHNNLICLFKSLKVAETMYDTFWYKESKQYNVLLQLMLMRTQRPVTMRIGPFGAMTTSTILTVIEFSNFRLQFKFCLFQTMRAAYSYATLMMNSS